MIEMGMINAIASMGGLALVAGLGLGYASKVFHVEADPIVQKIDDALPADKMGRCGDQDGCAGRGDPGGARPHGWRLPQYGVRAQQGVDPLGAHRPVYAPR